MMWWQTAVKHLRATVSLPKSGKDFAQFLVVIAACFAAGILGLKLTILHPPVSPVWPPTGVALAALLLLGYRVWPAIFIASFLVCEAGATPLHASLAISIGNTLEALAAGRIAGKVMVVPEVQS